MRQLIAFSLAAILACPVFAGSRLVEKLARGEPQRVVVYGTSLTASGPWVTQMRDWMTNTYSGQLTLINSGLSGKNSKDGAIQLDTHVLTHQPDTVLIEFGVDDALTNYPDANFNLTVEQARSNLNGMIDRIITNRNDTEIILQTMNTVWDSTNNSNYTASNRPLLANHYAMYREVAMERGLLLIDHAVTWSALQTNNPSLYRNYIPDGVQPLSNATAAVTVPLLQRKLIGDVQWVTNTNAGPVLLEADICVYGDTAAAVCAAVQATRQGKRCVLFSPEKRLGGMTSGGLGFTDIGTAAVIGGMAREFYRRVYFYYLDNHVWTTESRSAYIGRSNVDPDNVNRVQFTFEPKVAERIITDMMAESGATAIHARLLRGGGVGVKKVGPKIIEIESDDGKYFVRADMFIDASYEGDLMAEAGVPYVIGREANTNYGESLNGIQVSRATSHQLPNGIDPYVEAGNPASGLLPGVEPAIGGSDGSADTRLQAYNFRMCLTDVASNRVMITQPEGYNEEDYRLLFRALAAGMPANFFTKSEMPNRKTDSNNNGGFSTDFIGGNYSITGGWNYAEASYVQRAEIVAAHRRYQMGLVWTLQNNTNISASIRSNTSWSVWGLPLDEFDETGGWPGQIYVREARRMLGAMVMTERHVAQYAGFIVQDPIGRGSYNLDSHHVQRYVTAGGMVKNEGDVQVGVNPYGISYRSIIPTSNSVNNLFVPVCLSATHMALGSIRMEPVYMILAQAAASASVQAIHDGVTVQEVDYTKLRAQLLADGQSLPAAATTTTTTIIIDNSDTNGVLISGTWIGSTARPGYHGTNYLHDNNASKGANSVRFTPTLPIPGWYTVSFRWVTDINRATNVPVDVVYPGGSNTVYVNQLVSNGVWVTLMASNFPAGTSSYVVVRNHGTTNFVIADAVRFVGTNPIPATVNIFTSNEDAVETGKKPAKVIVTRALADSSPLDVNISLSGTAAPTNDYVDLPSLVTIPAGASAVSVFIVPVDDGIIEGDETVTITVAEGPTHIVGAHASASVLIRDPPAHTWKHQMFSELQRADPEISGDLADPDLDGRPNYLEYALGGDPFTDDPDTLDPSASLDKVTPAFTLEYAKAAPELTYRVEQVESLLMPWNTSGVSAENYNPVNGRFYRSITLTPMDLTQYLRLHVTGW